MQWKQHEQYTTLVVEKFEINTTKRGSVMASIIIFAQHKGFRNTIVTSFNSRKAIIAKKSKYGTENNTLLIAF